MALREGFPVKYFISSFKYSSQVFNFYFYFISSVVYFGADKSVS